MKYLVTTILFLFLMFGNSQAAGSSAVAGWHSISFNLKILQVSWVADDTDGSVPNVTIEVKREGCLFAVLTNPGTEVTENHTCDATCATNEEFALIAHTFTTGVGGDIVQSSVTECGMTANTNYYACPATTGSTANFFKLDDTNDTCASILNLSACTLTGTLSISAPTDNYDMVINGPDGVDLAGGQLANRDEYSTERVRLNKAECVKGDITITLTNNSINSATGVLKAFFGR